MEKIIKRIYSQFQKNPIVTTDSRYIKAGSIFFALKGENFNGNEFAQKAIENGASLAVIDEMEYYLDDRFIFVSDSLIALQELAKRHRKNLKAKIIGITGSNGKTTTKELIQATLSQYFKTKATRGNFNNHIGVPLTLLSFPTDLEFGIVEMGANHPGEIETLSKISQPDFGLITNIGKAHLEGFGGFEGVIKTKNELYQYIRKTGKTIFINSDNEILYGLSEGVKSITYGTKANSYCNAEMTSAYPYVKIVYSINNKRYEVQSKLFGSYNFENILAAICMGSYFGVPQNLIQKAINTYEPTNNRSQIINTETNKIILDAYNANPSSMKVAIQNFLESQEKNKFLILGDMLELGKDSSTEHAHILGQLESMDKNRVFLVGKYFSELKQQKFDSFQNTNELSQYIKQNPVRNGTILIKGSRGIKLEEIITLL
jgi:UDP-N-acetylmuramoyl-tripeptide--D-alanyl-D-alanine ligase